MRYLLTENFALRGWKQLPHTILRLDTKQVESIDAAAFQTLSFCNGLVDFDWLFIDEKMKALLPDLCRNGIIKECGLDGKLAKEQEYVLYDNRFISKAHWSITGKCNYRCKHCYMSAPEAKFGELSHEQCIRIIDGLADCGVYQMSITGGEPLIRKDFWELVDHMLEKGLMIGEIYSNGALVTEDFLKKLEERKLHPVIDMSFDGVGWHDWLRGIDGAEKRVTEAFVRCRDHGIKTRSELCLHQLNKHVLRESILELARLGVSSVKVNPVSEVGAWKENGRDLTLKPEELLELYLEYVPQYYEDGAPMDIQLGGFFMGKKGQKVWGDDSKFFYCGEESMKQCICGHARNVMYISPDAHALPCMSLSGMEIQDKFPVITEIGLKKCLTDSFFMNMITLTLEDYLKANPECAACENRYTCGGGCRASALSSGNDFLQKDPVFCLIYKGGYKKRLLEILEGLGIQEQQSIRKDVPGN